MNRYRPIGVERGAAAGSLPSDLPARPGHVSNAKSLTLASPESPLNVPAAGTGEKYIRVSVLSCSHH